ncbi:MAG: M3 family oligoendopeptidase [Firmicutes bacterium]|nr:M3 family oligoendopeptidase [Bacillota bacterium]
MTGTWSLNELYPSFESIEFTNDVLFLKSLMCEIKDWINSSLNSHEKASEKTEHYISFMNKYGDISSKVSEYCQLFLSTEAENAVALKNLEAAEEMDSELVPLQTHFEKWFSSLENTSEVISSSPMLEKHRYYLESIVRFSHYTLDSEKEKIISKMRNTGSLAFMKLWEASNSTLTVNMEGKEYPFPEIRNMAYSPDSSLRKKAYKSEIETLKTVSRVSAACLNAIKGEVITCSSLRGYSSPLEMTLLSSRMDSSVLTPMIDSMKRHLPIFRKYLSKKAETLGHKNGLPFYDLFAPVGVGSMKYSYDDAKHFITESFSSFSNELGNYAKKAFSNRWIDVYPKNGKRGGAFCSNLHSIKESRILTNFSGNFNDVVTIAHELGHGYHGACLDNETYLNSDYPMPIAETASTFCEILVKNAALKNATPEQKIFILETDISDSTQIIVDILSRFIFEDSVFEKRKHGSLSEEELCQIMENAQKETYGSGLDTNFMHKYMWVLKPHYYDVDYNYYNYPYAFGMLFAKGLHKIYSEKGNSFANDYKKLLGMTGKAELKDVASAVGIDICSECFWDSCLEAVSKDIEEFISMI